MAIRFGQSDTNGGCKSSHKLIYREGVLPKRPFSPKLFNILWGPHQSLFGGDKYKRWVSGSGDESEGWGSGKV